MDANHGREPWTQKARADGFKTVRPRLFVIFSVTHRFKLFVRLLQPTSPHLFGQGKIILKENSWYTQAYAARNCTEYPKVHRLC